MDYAALLATAKRLIRANGRQITLVQLGTATPDASKPWLGNEPATEVATTVISAVAVPASQSSSLGFRAEQIDLLKDVSEVMVVEPGEDTPDTLDSYHLVRQGAADYRIAFVERLRPADVTLLYFIGVKR